MGIATLSSSNDYSEVIAYVRRAVDEGDKLPNYSLGLRPRVRRRALIIAPTYEEAGQSFPPLPSTVIDAKRIHEMLLQAGYAAENIRMLCDACDGFYGLADPTRENILSSLAWLVSDTRSEDYRFLCFSGHGERILSDSTRGKEARVVVQDPIMSIPGDSELYWSWESYGRMREQIIPVRELVYYNEAIVTRFRETRRDGDPEHSSLIWDYELNAYLSKLPRHSTATCIIDCDASGRILSDAPFCSEFEEILC